MSEFVGIGKTTSGASAAWIGLDKGLLQFEIFLEERLSCKKNHGGWPSKSLALMKHRHSLVTAIFDNRDVLSPKSYEKILNENTLFKESLQQSGHEVFSANKAQFVPHHLAHACGAVIQSPMDEALVVVWDGAGSEAREIKDHGFESELLDFNGDLGRWFEELSVYSWKDRNLTPLKKRWHQFESLTNHKEIFISSGLGILYETAARYIFNDKEAAGKVMGLAAFGKAQPIKDSMQFLKALDWNQSFQGKTKKDWEESKNLSLYQDIAASVQVHFEKAMLQFYQNLKVEYPQYRHIILTGGCALNCTTNGKLAEAELFDEIFVPPNPGDEGIGLGCAAYGLLQAQSAYRTRSWDQINAYSGAFQKSRTSPQMKNLFANFEVIECKIPEVEIAELISNGHIVAWFQGSSEVGPRALGHRSLLARIDLPGIKDRLNRSIKGREAFRPFGCSVTLEMADEYFECHSQTQNPFMSFAFKVKNQWKDRFQEVCHKDGSSRPQTLSESQNPQFYLLLKAMGQRTGIEGVLNTSLNVMGEPILETAEDLKRFLDLQSVDFAYCDGFILRRSNTSAR